MLRKIILILALPGIFLALLLVLLVMLSFTPAGYAVASIFGTEYYVESDYELHEIEMVGALPPSFNLVLLGTPKIEMPIPGFLFYHRDQHKLITVNLRVPRELGDVQHIELTKLELQLDDGRMENLLTAADPLTFFLADHKHQHKARFDSSLWPPTETAKLIAEGILTTVSGNSEPFRQTSKWQVEEKKGFRKVVADYL